MMPPTGFMDRFLYRVHEVICQSQDSLLSSTPLLLCGLTSFPYSYLPPNYSTILIPSMFWGSEKEMGFLGSIPHASGNMIFTILLLSPLGEIIA